jgi:hypothetical protein
MTLSVPRPSITSHQPQSLPAVVRRVKGEYAEMPGLALTTPQAIRLFGLDAVTCRAVFEHLASTGYLRESNGRYMRR